MKKMIKQTHILGQMLTISETILYLQEKKISLQAEYDNLEKMVMYNTDNKGKRKRDGGLV
jgi:hypothetical protein